MESSPPGKEAHPFEKKTTPPPMLPPLINEVPSQEINTK